MNHPSPLFWHDEGGHEEGNCAELGSSMRVAAQPSAKDAFNRTGREVDSDMSIDVAGSPLLLNHALKPFLAANGPIVGALEWQRCRLLVTAPSAGCVSCRKYS